MFGQALDPSHDDVLADLLASADPSHCDDFEDVLKSLLEGSLVVLNRQLKAYLVGELSTPSTEMLEQTKGAPAHNIVSEQVLGLTDHQYHRAPNATIGFIDGKVKASKNKTLAWLNSKDHDEQERLVSFAVNRARKMHSIRKKREDDMNEIYHKRECDKIQKKGQKHRNQIEKKVKSVISDPPRLDQEFADTPDGSDSKLQTVRRVLQDYQWLVGKYIEHVWYEHQSDIQFHGRICSLKWKETTVTSVIVAYWSTDETEDDTDDYQMTISQILTDLVLNDLVFLQL